MFGVVLTDAGRITLILVLRWSSPRSLTYRLKSSSPRRCGKNLIGQSNRWTRIGNFERGEFNGCSGFNRWSLRMARMASVRLHGFAWLGLGEGTCGFGSWHGVMAVNQWRVLEGRLPRSGWGVVHACMHGRSRRTRACQCTIPIVCFFPCAVIFCT